MQIFICKFNRQEPAVQSPWSYPLSDNIISSPSRNPPTSTNFKYTAPSNTSSQTNTITLLQKAKG